MKPLAVALGALELFVGLGALYGGGALALRPDGSLLSMPVSLLHRSPFATYLIPGLILFGIVGGANTLAGILTLRGGRSGGTASLLAASILIIWIAAQVMLIGYQHWAQTLYLGFGLLMLILAPFLPKPARFS